VVKTIAALSKGESTFRKGRARWQNAAPWAPSPPTPLPQGERGEDLHSALRCANCVNVGTLPPSPPRGRGAGGEGAFLRPAIARGHFGLERFPGCSDEIMVCSHVLSSRSAQHWPEGQQFAAPHRRRLPARGLWIPTRASAVRAAAPPPCQSRRNAGRE